MSLQAIPGIKGFLGTSLIDYPGKIAAVVFLSGCNLSCPFCHNRILAQQHQELEDVQLEELIGGLSRRRKLLDGVVVTGGEPTRHPQVEELVQALKATGLAVKLDTNGMLPGVLHSLLSKGLLDYVAVDMKLAGDRYPAELGGPRDAGQRLADVVAMLRSSGVQHEFRTTCVPGLVSAEDIAWIAGAIHGAPAYYLQQYTPVHVDDPELAQRPAYPREVLERFLDLARPHVQTVGLRNL